MTYENCFEYRRWAVSMLQEITDELVIKKPSKTRNQLRDLGNNSLWRKPKNWLKSIPLTRERSSLLQIEKERQFRPRSMGFATIKDPELYFT